MATPWQPFSGSLGACADLSSSFSLQVRARAFCEDEERIVLSFGIFWSVFVTMAAFFSAGDSRKDVFGGWTFLKQLPTARRASFLVARSRHRRSRGSVKLGTFGLHDHVNEASKVFLRHFLCCASTCFRPCRVSRKPNVDLNIFRSHVIRCSLVSLVACFSFSSWRRRLTPVTVAETAAKNRHLAASGHLRFFFFLKKKESLFFNKDSLSSHYFSIKTPLSSLYDE